MKCTVQKHIKPIMLRPIGLIFHSADRQAGGRPVTYEVYMFVCRKIHTIFICCAKVICPIKLIAMWRYSRY